MAKNLMRMVEANSYSVELRKLSDRDLALHVIEGDIYGHADFRTEALLSELACRALRANGPVPPDWNSPHGYVEGFDACAHCGEKREHELHYSEVSGSDE